eukprot:805094-Pyramimonas_sp.AAC.1
MVEQSPPDYIVLSLDLLLLWRDVPNLTERGRSRTDTVSGTRQAPQMLGGEREGEGLLRRFGSPPAS